MVTINMIFLHIKVQSSENPYEMFRNMGLGINSIFLQNQLMDDFTEKCLDHLGLYNVKFVEQLLKNKAL